MKRRVILDVYIVVSESVFLVLEPEQGKKGIAKLASWGTLPTIDNIIRNLENPDFLTISWRKVDDKEPGVLKILLPNNANDCVSLILKHIKKQGLTLEKKYETKPIVREELPQEVEQPAEIEKLLEAIFTYE